MERRGCLGVSTWGLFPFYVSEQTDVKAKGGKSSLGLGKFGKELHEKREGASSHEYVAGRSSMNEWQEGHHAYGDGKEHPPIHRFNGIGWSKRLDQWKVKPTSTGPSTASRSKHSLVCPSPALPQTRNKKRAQRLCKCALEVRLRPSTRPSSPELCTPRYTRYTRMSTSSNADKSRKRHRYGARRCCYNWFLPRSETQSPPKRSLPAAEP